MAAKRDRSDDEECSDAKHSKTEFPLAGKRLLGQGWSIDISHKLFDVSDFLQTMADFDDDIELVYGDLTTSKETQAAVNGLCKLYEFYYACLAFDKRSFVLELGDSVDEDRFELMKTVCMKKIQTEKQGILRLLHQWERVEHSSIVHWFGPNSTMLKYLHQFRYNRTPAGFVCNSKFVFTNLRSDIRDCCERGNLAVAKWLIEVFEMRHGVHYWNCLHHALTNFHIDTAQYLLEFFEVDMSEYSKWLTVSQYFTDACSRNKVCVVEWMIKTFPRGVLNLEHGFDYALNKCSRDVCEYLVTKHAVSTNWYRFASTLERLMGYEYYMQLHIDMIEWIRNVYDPKHFRKLLHRYSSKWVFDKLYEAYKRGWFSDSLRTFRLLIRTKSTLVRHKRQLMELKLFDPLELTNVCFAEAFRYGSMEDIVWLHGFSHLSIDEHVNECWISANRQSSVEKAEWLLTHTGISLDTDGILYTENLEYDFVKFVYAHLSDAGRDAFLRKVFVDCIKTSKMNIAKWIVRQKRGIEVTESHEAFEIACEHGRITDAQWLWALGFVDATKLGWAMAFACSSQNRVLIEWVESLATFDEEQKRCFVMHCIDRSRDLSHYDTVKWLVGRWKIWFDYSEIPNDSIRLDINKDCISSEYITTYGEYRTEYNPDDEIIDRLLARLQRYRKKQRH